METVTKQLDDAKYIAITNDDLFDIGHLRNGGKTTTWVAKINDYKDAKDVEREFLPYPEEEIDSSLLSVGDILQIRHDDYYSNKYRDRFEATFIVREITDTNVVLERHKTIYKAWKTRKAEKLKEDKTVIKMVS